MMNKKYLHYLTWLESRKVVEAFEAEGRDFNESHSNGPWTNLDNDETPDFDDGPTIPIWICDLKPRDQRFVTYSRERERERETATHPQLVKLFITTFYNSCFLLTLRLDSSLSQYQMKYTEIKKTKEKRKSIQYQIL